MFVEKSNVTSLKKYGIESFSKTQEFINKTAETNRRKFGADWKSQTLEGRPAIQKTCMERYGVDNFSKFSKHISTKMTDSSKLEAWMEFRDDPEGFIKSRFDCKPTCLSSQKSAESEIHLSAGFSNSKVNKILSSLLILI